MGYNPATGMEDPNYPPPTEAPPPPAGTVSGPATPNPDVQYNNDGTVKTEAQIAEAGDPADYGPVGMPAASASDAPFSEDVVPGGWSRFPTGEEVAYLNKKYPAP
jgi:hypothetical protein